MSQDILHVNAVANTFLKLADKHYAQITNIKLQKLLYFAAGFYYTLTGKELFYEDMEAWKYGPVVPEIYHEFKHFLNYPIYEKSLYCDPFTENLKEMYIENINSGHYRATKAAFNLFAGKDSFELVQESHVKNGPWYRVYNPNEMHNLIKFQEGDKSYFQELTDRLIADN